MKTIKVKVHKPIIGHEIDQIVSVDCDDEGTPLNFFWRRQLKAAKLDGCCEVVTETKPIRKKVVRDVSVADEGDGE